MLLAAALTLALLPVTDVAEAAPIVPFNPRFATNDTGAIFAIGNNLLTCPATDARCAGSLAGTQKVNNNNFSMVNLDVDADPSTRNSSNAQLLLPEGSQVLWAGLYWGARFAAGRGGVAGVGNRANLSFRGPSDVGYSTVTASTVFGPTAGDLAYQGFVDVTPLVQAQGSGTYWAGNIAAGTGEDRYGGWSLVTVFRNATLPLRNLTVFDGFSDVGQGNPETITISGFLAPTSGPVDAEVRVVAYEGDFATSGDTAQLQNTQLGTTLSPGSNFFNGANDLNGASVQTRNPTHLNMLGFDIKRLGVPGAIPNEATSATVALKSTGDRYFPGVVATSINLYAPDFSTSSKSVADLGGNDPARVDDVLQYTLTYSNTGQDPAESSVMTDPIPAGTEYVPGSLSIVSGPNAGPKTDEAGDDQGEFDPGAGVVRVRLGEGANGSQGGVIDVDASTTVTFQVRLLAPSAGTTVVNAADLDYVASTLNDPFVYRVAPVSTPVAPRADLAVAKVTNPDPGLAGSTVSSTITVTNAGPNPASDVVVTDQLPDDVVVLSATPSQGACSPSATLVTCEVGTVPVGAPVTVTVVASIPAGSTSTSFTNLANVSSSIDDPDPENNTSGSSVGVERAADLVVVKTPSAAVVVPGTGVSYTITATNTGPSDASNVLLTDAAPDAQITLVAASAPGGICTASPDLAQCSVATLLAGQSVTMTVDAVVDAGAPGGVVLGNSATISSDTPDPDPDDNETVVSITTAEPQANLQVAKTESGATIAGGQVTYSVNVVNAGPSAAREVVVTDVLPPGLTIVSATPSRGTCDIVPPLTCTIGDLPGPGGGAQLPSAEITIVADIAADTPAGSIVNTATVASSTSDPDPADNSSSVTSVVETLADLEITKAADPQQPVAGENVTFTITVTNRGPSSARGVVLTDVLPPELNLVSLTPPAGVTCDGSPSVCALGDLAVGATATVVVVMNVPSSADLVAGVSQTASVGSATPDPSSVNNSATVTITSRAISDLITLKFINAPFEEPVELVAGTQVTYQLAVGNFGPSNATTAQVIDELPPGVTYVSSVPECSAVGQVVTCNLPSVPVDFAAIFPIVVQLDADLPAGTQLTNNASVALTDPTRVDPVSSNNATVLTNPVVTRADLSVVKTSFVFDYTTGLFTEPASGPAGSPAGFRLEIRNDGPSVARNVTLLDTSDLEDFLLTGVRLVRGGEVVDLTASCSLAAADLQCPLGDVPVFAADSPSWLIQVDGAFGSAADEGAYTNTASLTSATTDTNDVNNTSVAPVTVTEPRATLTIDKQSLSGDSLLAGSTFTYQLSVANILDPTQFGLSDADDVVATDTLPAGLTATTASSSQGSCTITPPSTVTCDLGTVLGPIRLPEPPPVLITISGTIASNVTGTSLINSATVTSPISAPATDTLELPVNREVDLFITKVAESNPFVAGATARWTLVLGNAGPSDASGVDAGERLPDGVTFLPDESSPGCAEVEPTFVVCPIGDLAVGETRTLTIAGTTPADSAPRNLTNVAAIGSSEVGDLDFDNNLVELTTPLVQQADLGVSKVASSPTPSVGTELTYSIGVDNAGPSVATNVVVVDQLPPGVVPVSVTTISGILACVISGSEVRCTADELAAGGSDTVSIVVEIPDGSPPGPLANTATLSSDTADPDPANNESTVTVDVGVVSDLSIEKTVETNPVVTGQPVTFRLTVTNNGPATAPDVTTSDTLPAGTTFVAAEPAEGCVVNEQEGVVVVTCSLGPLAPGASAFSTVTLIAPTATGSFENVGSVGSGALDPCPTDGLCLSGDDRGNEDGVSFEVVNRPPVAVDDLGLTAFSGVPLTIDVLEDDFDPDGDPIEVTAVTQPENGTAVIGSVIYTSNPGYVGPDQFTYTICDIPYEQCDDALVTLTIIAPPASPPVAPPVESPASGGAGLSDDAPRRVATTGQDVGTWLSLGLVSVLAGALLLWSGRRSRSEAEARRSRP